MGSQWAASGVPTCDVDTALLLGGLVQLDTAGAWFSQRLASSLAYLQLGKIPFVQGLGAPACARILTSWYPDTERGTFWGFWVASNNIGGFAAPILAGTAATMYGWR